MTETALEFRNVTKSFDGVPVVKEISFRVGACSIYGLVGCNGAGKTTLLKMAAGIYKPDRGSVLADGEDVFDNAAVRGRLFFVPDDLYFPLGATVRSMARFYADYYPAFQEKTLQNILNLFGLDSKKPLRGFSKGMQRQAEIALGLSTHPKYLLLDETFDGLDPQKREFVRKLLLEYAAENDASILIASHNLPELANLCDHIGLVNGKRLTMDCDVNDVSRDYIKVRAVFGAPLSTEQLDAIHAASRKDEGVSATFVFHGNYETERPKLDALAPLAVDEFALTLEEIFLSEMEDKDYDVTKIFES